MSLRSLIGTILEVFPLNLFLILRLSLRKTAVYYSTNRKLGAEGPLNSRI